MSPKVATANKREEIMRQADAHCCAYIFDEGKRDQRVNVEKQVTAIVLTSAPYVVYLLSNPGSNQASRNCLWSMKMNTKDEKYKAATIVVTLRNMIVSCRYRLLAL